MKAWFEDVLHKLGNAYLIFKLVVLLVSSWNSGTTNCNMVKIWPEDWPHIECLVISPKETNSVYSCSCKYLLIVNVMQLQSQWTVDIHWKQNILSCNERTSVNTTHIPDHCAEKFRVRFLKLREHTLEK